MKKNLLVSLIAVGSVLSAGNTQAQLSQISVMPGHPNTPTIYQPPSWGYANFPDGKSMDVLNGSSISKRLMVSFGTNPDKPGISATTARIFSTDGGVTWGSYQAYGHDALMTIRRRNGTIVTYPFSQTLVSAPNYSLKYWTSPVNSNGASWLPAYPGYNTGTVNTNMQGHRSIIEEPDGTLYACGYQTNIKIIKSTDGGATWTWMPPAVMTGSQPDNAYSEPALERCADGSWLIVARLDGQGVGMRYSRSTDHGVTWTAPAPLNGVPIQSGFSYDVDPHLQLMPNGVLVLSYGSRKISPDWRYCNTRVAFSTNNGVTWTNIADTFVGAMSSGVAPGTMTTGYTAAVPVSAHRFLVVGDTGTNKHYATELPSPNPFSIWGKYVDIVLAQQNRIDLKTKYAQGAVTIMPATTLTYTDANHPEARTSGAFDGSTDYWSGALGTTSGVYQLDLQKTFRISTIGLAMLYGKQQSATVEYATAASPTTWISAGVSYSNATHYCLNYTNVTAFNARYIRVTVSGSGQVGLGELELYEASSTFENNAAAISGDPHGPLPTGYVADGTSSTEYGVAVVDGMGYQSNRALRLWDGSSTWRAGVKKIVSASNKKTLEFRCRISGLPTTGMILIPIRGTVSGAEGIVFYVAIAGSTSTQGVVKYNNGSGWTQIGTATLPISASVWKLVKIEADEAANTAALYIDNVLMGSFTMYANATSATNLTGFGFNSNGTVPSGESIYLDDINFYDPTVSGPSGISSANVASQNVLTSAFAADTETEAVVKGKFGISISPNPASNMIRLQFQNATKGPVTVRFANLSGTTVKNLKYNLEAGTSSLEIPVGDLLPAVYIIQAKQGDKAGVAKLIVNEFTDSVIR